MLYEADHEVFYDSSKEYEKKPYAGIITTCNDFRYFIPLTSAKPKHLEWKNISDKNIIIYEEVGSDDVPEYSLKPKIHKIEEKANKLYKKQIERGIIPTMCCNFLVLEKICTEYKEIPDNNERLLPF